MKFNKHLELGDSHAPFSPSQPYWLRYDDAKLEDSFHNKQSAEMGTKLHAWAKQTIDLGIRQARSKKTLCSYVNDAIGFNMDTEVRLVYSDLLHGTADAICVDKDILRIHDLKTGVTPASMEQLLVYAALFFSEYAVDPFSLKTILRIYQNDEIVECQPEPKDLIDIQKRITYIDSFIRNKFDLPPLAKPGQIVRKKSIL